MRRGRRGFGRKQSRGFPERRCDEPRAYGGRAGQTHFPAGEPHTAQCDAMDENEKIIRQRCEDELQLEKQLVEIAEKLDELAKALRIDEDSETLAFNPF